jgi:hypothetical protein
LVRARLPFPYSSRALLPFALLCLAWVRSLQPPSRKRTQKRTKQSKQTVSSYWFKKIKLGEPAVPPTAPHPSPPHFTPPPPPSALLHVHCTPFYCLCVFAMSDFFTITQ